MCACEGERERERERGGDRESVRKKESAVTGGGILLRPVDSGVQSSVVKVPLNTPGRAWVPLYTPVRA